VDNDQGQTLRLPTVVEAEARPRISPSRVYAIPRGGDRIPDEITADAARGDTMDRLMHAWQGRFTKALVAGRIDAYLFRLGDSPRQRAGQPQRPGRGFRPSPRSKYERMAVAA
jgi:hypothetical protein